MPDRIEPPILLSRMLTFVFAAAAVMLVVMIVTVANMFPLTRPQVFILTTQPRADVEMVVQAMSPDDANVEMYKINFIKEYIKARNEIVTDRQFMRKKWDNSEYGIVRNWSGDAVLRDFYQTSMVNAILNDMPEFEFQCPVEFRNGAIKPYRGDDTYQVSFSYFCSDSNRQSPRKDYTIIVKLEFDANAGRPMRWANRINNPLGIRISEYNVGNGGDPLNGFSDDAQ
ncbi:MAG: hypothetical protein IJ560_00685 [Alphaproteobacteria bacterium]|nr:hypothetical protein [Alphaproteobacteria bacterium]